MWVQTADLSDDRGKELQVCTLDLREYGGSPRASGSVRTVSCRDDTVLLKQVIEEDGTDQVLVVDGAGSRACALFGEKSARVAVDHGWQAIIINGLIRDVVALQDLPISVKALGSTPQRAHQDGTGAVDVLVGFGGVLFRPGAALWSDEDGIVVSRPAGR